MKKSAIILLAFGVWVCLGSEVFSQTTLSGDHIIDGDLDVGTSGNTSNLRVTGNTGLGVATAVRRLDVLGNSAATSYGLRIINPFAAPSSANRILQEFVMKNTSGADVVYGAIGAYSAGVTPGSEIGYISFHARDGGVLSTGVGVNITGKGQVFAGGAGSSGISDLTYKFVSLNGGLYVGGDGVTNAAAANVRQYGNNGNSPVFELFKHRGTTFHSYAPVINGDTVFTLVGTGVDTDSKKGELASMVIQVDAPPGVSSLPGRLIFKTTSPNSNVATERMRITSAGNVGIGKTNPTVKLDVNGDAKFSGKVTMIRQGDILMGEFGNPE